jgi:hypothetical protein
VSATFHLDLSAVSRGRGQSAVARAAYNSREKLYDPFLDKWFNYSKKKYSEKKEELVWSEIITPPGIPTISRQELWQLAENSEKRKDAVTARQIIVALPRALSQEEQKELVRQFCQELTEEYQVAVDVNIHDPKKEEGKENPHAHIMFTSRPILRERNEFKLGKKIRKFNLPDSAEEVKKLRKEWQEMANKALEKYGLAINGEARNQPNSYLPRADYELAKRGIFTRKATIIQDRNLKIPESISQEIDKMIPLTTKPLIKSQNKRPNRGIEF